MRLRDALLRKVWSADLRERDEKFDLVKLCFAGLGMSRLGTLRWTEVI